MRQIYYTFLTLLRARDSHVIKTVSLTLGLFVGVLLFAQIAFEISFDSHYKGVEQIYKIENHTYRSGDGPRYDPWLNGPATGAFVEGLPEEIECGTVFKSMGPMNMFYDDRRTQPVTTFADTAYFHTLGIDVLVGDPRELTHPDVSFVSEKYARDYLGKDSPVGKVLLYNKTFPITIKGVYKEIPENSTLRPDVIISLATPLKYEMFHWSWQGGSVFSGYLRIRPGVDPEKLEARMNHVAGQYISTDPQNEYAIRYSVKPLKNMHRENESVRRMHTILFVLAFSILFIAAMNYVLIAIASLYKRSKAIGVHKCNGASQGDIFFMFLWETILILFISCICTVLLVVTFRGIIEDILGASLLSLFTWKTLWVPVCTLLLLFLFSGILPGKIFSSVPVTQVFRRYTERKNSWKRPLLFIQFAGISFVLGLLCVTWVQYRHIINRNVGYDTEAVAFVENEQITHPEMLKNVLKSLPMVEQVSISAMDLLGGYSGDRVTEDNGEFLFTACWNIVDYDFLPTTGLILSEGRNIQVSGEMLVNEEFVRQRGWKGSAVGQPIYVYGKRAGVIVGVLKDFPTSSAYGSILPFMMASEYYYDEQRVYNVHLKPPYKESLQALNEEIERVFPRDDLEFHLYQEEIERGYAPALHFRDSVVIASVSILLISLMGLFGYVNDEIRRRSKEIAIRKVNGAHETDILSLFSYHVFRIALVSVGLGVVSSYFIGQKWLEQFADQIPISIPLYVLVVLIVNLLIHLAVIFKTWSIARENPVLSIKAE
ncbi:MAG: ABC transporter permease [Bacteroides sp.]|nr:ABC transporter permease [Bacteroides sp.]